ncbi:helix-turn-helix domain-containing protein [Fodinibius sp. SL11]|uniref:helix-turn-helix domain-containing protein n=1 Tax=Fodinibius sp. SL11 TaxID=3425690 RepID=UPI003F881890
MTTLQIKNMVCDRCIMTVQQVLQDLDFEIESIALGKVILAEDLVSEDLEKISEELVDKGFELIKKNDKALLEQIKVQLIDYLKHLEDAEDSDKVSAFLERNLHYNYSYLSKYFSDHSGVTIEKYLINLKIERVKELLSYDELTLSEIAWKLNYSSVQYLSNQFKKVTGETVSSFRSHIDENSRQSLDAI